MKTYSLTRDQWIQQPLEKIYEFFERPENLAQITPDSLDFKLLTPSPVLMQRGRVIDYTIRFKRIPIRWRTIISSYDPPYQFVDEQLKGPYSYWHHSHSFKSENGGTRLIDKVIYALPIYLPYPLSALSHRFLVRPELERIFDYRELKFDQLFNCGQRVDKQTMNQSGALLCE